MEKEDNIVSKVISKEDNIWKKTPRSSRVCYRCGHKYSSHIDVRCLKLIQKKPDRIECLCRGFIKDKEEMDMYDQRINYKLKLQNELIGE